MGLYSFCCCITFILHKIIYNLANTSRHIYTHIYIQGKCKTSVDNFHCLLFWNLMHRQKLHEFLTCKFHFHLLSGVDGHQTLQTMPFYLYKCKPIDFGLKTCAMIIDVHVGNCMNSLTPSPITNLWLHTGDCRGAVASVPTVDLSSISVPLVVASW